METSYPDENARLRALLQEQQTTIRKMAEYNRLLSQRVAAYASEINRLKALVAKLQRMQFGKSSEKLREKTQRQVREAEERISALQEEMAEVLGDQHDPVLPQPLRQPAGSAMLGVRASALALQARPGDVALQGLVHLAEISGSDTFVHVQLPWGDWVAQLTGVHKVGLNQPVSVYLSPLDCYIFERELPGGQGGALLQLPVSEAGG